MVKCYWLIEHSQCSKISWHRDYILFVDKLWLTFQEKKSNIMCLLRLKHSISSIKHLSFRANFQFTGTQKIENHFNNEMEKMRGIWNREYSQEKVSSSFSQVNMRKKKK